LNRSQPRGHLGRWGIHPTMILEAYNQHQLHILKLEPSSYGCPYTRNESRGLSLHQWITMFSNVDQQMLDDAKRVVEEATKQTIFLRLLGAMGVRINASKHEDLFLRLNRLNSTQEFTDIDFAAYSTQRSQVTKLLKELGYEIDRNALLRFGNSRIIVHQHVKGYSADVFFDRLHYSHDVVFGHKPESGRLHLSPLTISPEDLALEKLQIHEINEKDIKDLIVLFVANIIGNTDGENVINGGYIAETLADDWEFWYEVTINLDKVRKFLPRYRSEGLIDAKTEIVVLNRIEELTTLINDHPKSRKWQKRERAGAEKKWWRDVEERSR
jgi:hypothetical protein